MTKPYYPGRLFRTIAGLVHQVQTSGIMIKKIILSVSIILSARAAFSQEFIRRDGKKLMYQGEEILLRGMAFGNMVWDDRYTPDQHHSEADFRRVSALGMNVLRFYMNYKTFEDDANPYSYKASGWQWIDRNIQWAKKHNIFLILNMHVPQGGFQSQCDGDELWTKPENQDRVTALWKAIAERYKDEPQIAGYDLINEPIPVESTESWSLLAQRIIDSIRSVDNNHLIITERAIALDCNYGYADANNNYPQITEENLMYTVHLYDPHEFTHQLLDWAGTGDGGSYPDPDLITAPSDAGYATGNYSNPSVKTGTSGWTYYEGVPFTIDTDTLVLGRVVFVSNGINSGRVWFDDIEVRELDSQGNLIRVLFSDPLNKGSFWWWSSDNTGTHTTASSGHNDNFSVMVTGNKAAASVICPSFAFRITKGNQYVISGWMKGENIPAGASASITTEFYHSPSGSQPYVRNYEFLRDKIVQYAQYIEDKGFPVYFGEFGAARTAFENNKGGERWVADALKIFDSLGYHFTYHSYKESSFGYYDGWDQPVDTTTVNTKLQKVFKEFFGKTSVPTGTKKKVENKLRLYPNPAGSQVTVILDQPGSYTVEVLNMNGSRMLQTRTGTIDVSSLPKGTYIVKVQSGSHMYYDKLIVK